MGATFALLEIQLGVSMSPHPSFMARTDTVSPTSIDLEPGETVTVTGVHSVVSPVFGGSMKSPSHADTASMIIEHTVSQMRLWFRIATRRSDGATAGTLHVAFDWTDELQLKLFITPSGLSWANV